MKTVIFTVNIKLAIITIVSSLALGGTGVLIWQSTHRTPDSTFNQAIDISSPEKHENPLISKKAYTGNLTKKQKKEVHEYNLINEALVWLDSQKPDEKIYEIQSMSEQSYVPPAGTKTPSFEIQKKASLYAKLSLILPEYKRLESTLTDMYAGTIDQDPSIEDRLDGLTWEIVNIFGSILRPPAFVMDDAGNKYVADSAPMFTQIAEYLGKELPYDGNPDYFSAKDYQSKKSNTNSQSY